MNSTNNINKGRLNYKDLLKREERYKLDHVIGQGGCGVVYKAFDQQLGREVAIKFIPDTSSTSLFEAQALAKCDHDSIVKVFDLIDCGGSLAIIMEFVEQANPLNNQFLLTLELEEFCRIYSQILNAVASIHSSGLLHLDLKPANILLDKHQRIKITDFGIAQACNASGELYLRDKHTNQSNTRGSWWCLSPEHLGSEDLSSASDIFALGILLYTFLYKAHPFLIKGDLKKTKENILKGRLLLPSLLAQDIPQELEQLVKQALRTDPSQRPSLHDMQSCFRRFQKTTTRTNDSKSPSQQISNYRKLQKALSSRTKKSLFIGLSVLFFGSISYLITHQSPKTSIFIVPTLKVSNPEDEVNIKYLDYNQTLARLIERELKSAILSNEDRRLISKKLWGGTRHWREESKRMKADEILVSQVHCKAKGCTVQFQLYNRHKNSITEFAQHQVSYNTVADIENIISSTLQSKFGLSGH